MVFGDLLQHPVAPTVAARIANVAHQQAPGPEHAQHQRGPHASVRRVGVGRAEDRLVGVVDTDVHRALDVGIAGGGRGLVQPTTQFGLDEIAGHATGDFAGGVTTHAVGQHGDSTAFIQGDRIFVVGPHPPGIGLTIELEVHELIVAVFW